MAGPLKGYNTILVDEENVNPNNLDGNGHMNHNQIHHHETQTTIDGRTVIGGPNNNNNNNNNINNNLNFKRAILNENKKRRRKNFAFGITLFTLALSAFFAIQFNNSNSNNNSINNDNNNNNNNNNNKHHNKKLNHNSNNGISHLKSVNTDYSVFTVDFAGHDAIKTFLTEMENENENNENMNIILPRNVEVKIQNDMLLNEDNKGLDPMDSYLAFPLYLNKKMNNDIDNNNNNDNIIDNNNDNLKGSKSMGFAVIMDMKGDILNVLTDLHDQRITSLKIQSNSQIGLLTSRGELYNWDWKTNDLNQIHFIKENDDDVIHGNDFQYLEASNSYLIVKNNNLIAEIDAETGEEIHSFPIFKHGFMNNNVNDGGSDPTQLDEDQQLPIVKQITISDDDDSSDKYLLVSFQDNNAIYKIRLATGETEWILGGDAGQFLVQDFHGNARRPGDSAFHYQSAFEELGTGNMIVYDNGFNGQRQLYHNKIRLFQLDESKKIGKELWQYETNQDAAIVGDVHYLPTGNFLATSGRTTIDLKSENENFDTGIFQVSPEGNLVWELQLVSNFEQSYMKSDKKYSRFDVSTSELYGWSIPSVESFNDAPHIYDISLHNNGALSFYALNTFRTSQDTQAKLEIFDGETRLLAKQITLEKMWRPTSLLVNDLDLCNAQKENLEFKDGISIKMTNSNSESSSYVIPADVLAQGIQSMECDYSRSGINSDVNAGSVISEYILTPTPYPSPAPTITGYPTPTPSAFPTADPSEIPTIAPTQFPTISKMPTTAPTSAPTAKPSAKPSAQPTEHPSVSPTPIPSAKPTFEPTFKPTWKPTPIPTVSPTHIPTPVPSAKPTPAPSATPSIAPTTPKPTPAPSALPTIEPSSYPPTIHPTNVPTISPSDHPTTSPTPEPTFDPSAQPSLSPSDYPTHSPTPEPTVSPSPAPSLTPTAPTLAPTAPTHRPTHTPSEIPSLAPSFGPTKEPTWSPTTPTPTFQPTNQPTPRPTKRPTVSPTIHPTNYPTIRPTSRPTDSPTTSKPSAKPTSSPTDTPTTRPTPMPTAPSVSPTDFPTPVPTAPTPMPTRIPLMMPTIAPTPTPSTPPSPAPSTTPTKAPIGPPTSLPTSRPSAKPSIRPTHQPTTTPIATPTIVPTKYPTRNPTDHPTTSIPTASPTESPIPAPTVSPTISPTSSPTTSPTSSPVADSDNDLYYDADKDLFDVDSAKIFKTHTPTMSPSKATKAVVKSHPRANTNDFLTDVQAIIYVNSFADSNYGTCTAGEMDQTDKCSLRAAVALAQDANGKAVIMLPTEEHYRLIHGQILIKRGEINVVGQNGLAVIDGSYNQGRFLKILDSARFELAHVTIQNFKEKTDHGGAIWNEGSLTTYRAQFDSDTSGINGGAIYNTGIMNLRHYIFTSNAADTEGDDVFNKGSMYVEPYPFTGLVGGDEEFKFAGGSHAVIANQEELAYDLIINVNSYADSLDGLCEDGSPTCNLRAAVNLASLEGVDTAIIIPTEDSHYLTQGELTVSSLAQVKLTALSGVGIIDGSKNSHRFAHINADCYLELVHIVVSNFKAGEGITGGAIMNEGEIVTYRSEFIGNTAGDKGGAIANLENGIAAFWYTTFSENKGVNAESADIHNKGNLYFMPCDNEAEYDGEEEALCYDVEEYGQ